MNLMIAGIQGSGKGTHASHLSQLLGIKHISFGDTIKMCLEEEPELVYPYSLEKYNNGELAPDEVLFRVADKFVMEAANEGGFILDGFPRTQGQMDYVMKNIPIDVCIFLEISEEVAIKRLKSRGRSDDTEEGIKHRLKQFNEITSPIFTELEKAGKLHRVNTDQCHEDSFNDIMKVIAV